MINIKGKPYVMVNERIKAFRENEQYKDWSLETEIISLDNDICIMKAVIKDENGRIRATGLAQEVRTNAQSMVNKTSYIENCETSAWGRALGNLGIGINESIASAEEVVSAVNEEKNYDESVYHKKSTMAQNPDTITLEEALEHKTTKGIKYGDLATERLQWIVDNRPKSIAAEYARVVLDDRNKEDFEFVNSDEEAPF